MAVYSIIETEERWDIGSERLRMNKKDLMLEGKPPYFRILIRARDSRKGEDK